MEEQPGRVSRVGTARALVLLGSGVQLAATMLLCLVALVLDAPVLAVVPLVVITAADILLANLLALRARRTRRALAGGCGTLLAGTVLGIAVLLLLSQV